MQNGLKIQSGLIVRENGLAHGRTIEVARRIDHRIPEAFANFEKGRLTAGHNLARDHIGIDDRYAALGKQIGDRGFAAGDTAGQANTQRGLVLFSRHSEQRVEIEGPDLLAPKHRYPPGGSQVGPERNWNASLVLTEYHQ